MVLESGTKSWKPETLQDWFTSDRCQTKILFQNQVQICEDCKNDLIQQWLKPEISQEPGPNLLMHQPEFRAAAFYSRHKTNKCSATTDP